MEMRGEKVDVNTIRQNVREGMGTMRDKMKGWTGEVKESAQQFGDRAKEFASTRGRTFAAETSQAAQRAGRGIGHAIAVLFKVFFLFIAGSIAFALFVVIIGLIFGGVGFWPFTTYLFDGFWQKTYAWGTLIFFLGIPVIAFIVWLLRRLMKVKSQNNYLGWTFGGLWALGWVSVTLFAMSMVRDFRMSNYRRPAEELTVNNPVNNRMYVKVSEPEVEYSGSMPWFDIDGRGFDLTHDTLRIANIRIEEVELSPDSNYHVYIKRYSRGSTVSDAEARAQRMVYHASYRDSVLDLGSGLSIDSESKFRGQQVLVTISIPVGGRIQFDETVHKLRHDFDVHVDSDEERRRGRVEINWDFDYRTGVDYTMGADGRLRDSSGTPVRQSRDGYRYQPTERNESDSIRLEREIERKKQELQELERKKNQSTSLVRKDEILRSQGEEFSGPNVKMEWF
jgi:hypothetical protein